MMKSIGTGEALGGYRYTNTATGVAVTFDRIVSRNNRLALVVHAENIEAAIEIATWSVWSRDGHPTSHTWRV